MKDSVIPIFPRITYQSHKTLRSSSANLSGARRGKRYPRSSAEIFEPLRGVYSVQLFLLPGEVSIPIESFDKTPAAPGGPFDRNRVYQIKNSDAALAFVRSGGLREVQRI